MTQLERTLNLFCTEGQGSPISHKRGMAEIGFAFRSRASDLRLDYGIAIKTLNTNAEKEAYQIRLPSAQAYYVLEETPEEARAKYASGRADPPVKASTPISAPLSPICAENPQKGVSPGVSLALKRWKGHTPRKYKIGGREITMKEYKAMKSGQKSFI